MTFLWPTSQMGMLHPAAAIKEARDRADEFKRIAEYAGNGIAYQPMKGLFQLASSGVETRVAAFAEIGLLYGRGPFLPVALTPVGSQLASLMNAPTGSTESQEVTALLTWALSNCQINRPVSGGSPRITNEERQACNIRPYITAWSLMLDLDGVLYMHEFLGRVRRLQRVEDYDACVADIRQARANGSVFPNLQANNATNVSIYWRSRLSVAGQLLNFDNANQRLEFASGGEEIVEAVIEAQGGITGTGLTALRAKPWTTAEDYFAFAGAACSGEITGTVVDALALPAAAPTAAGTPSPALDPGSSSAEGQRKYRLQRQIERRSWVSREAKRVNAGQHDGLVTCEACDFGHADPGMMDAHHKDPLAGGIRQTSLGDLLILCPTCHRRAHRTADRLQPLELSDLQAWVQQGRP